MDKKLIIERISENLLIQRRRKNLTQDAVADAANISTKYYNLIENGKANPSITNIVNICKALDMELGALLR